MGFVQEFLPEFDREMAGVRKTLERVPEEKFEWRPHPKSGTMGWLASHLASLPGLFAVRVVEKDSHEAAPGGQPPSGPPKLKTRQEVARIV